MNVGGIVLCGGRSRRMAAPKAWLRCGNEYLLPRVVRIVGEAVRPVVVAARPGQSLPPLPRDVRVVHDAVEDGGPLAGLAAGFAALNGLCEAAFVCACDHPLLKAPFVRRLIDLLGPDSAAVPVHRGRAYCLTGVYRLETANVLDQLLAERNLRAEQFVTRCHARLVPSETLADADPQLDSLLNANDAAAFEQVLRALSASPSDDTAY